MFSDQAGRQPPSGPPVWTALKCLPPGMPPPTSKMMSPSGMPIGTSIRPVLLTLPVSAKIAVPGELGLPMPVNQFAPLKDDLRGHGVALDVVDVGGLAPEAADGGERGARAGFAAAAFDGGDQRGFFAADKRAGAALEMDIKAERAAEDVLCRAGRSRWPGRWPLGGGRWRAGILRGSR